MALVRKLLNYRWELRGHSVALVDLRNNTQVLIDKVRLMSFMKFAVNCMDKMRIEDIKKLRKQMADAKLRAKTKKIIKPKKIEAKAKITENIQNEKLFNET